MLEYVLAGVNHCSVLAIGPIDFENDLLIRFQRELVLFLSGYSDLNLFIIDLSDLQMHFFL